MRPDSSLASLAIDSSVVRNVEALVRLTIPMYEGRDVAVDTATAPGVLLDASDGCLMNAVDVHGT